MQPMRGPEHSHTPSPFSSPGPLGPDNDPSGEIKIIAAISIVLGLGSAVLISNDNLLLLTIIFIPACILWFIFLSIVLWIIKITFEPILNFFGSIINMFFEFSAPFFKKIWRVITKFLYYALKIVLFPFLLVIFLFEQIYFYLISRNVIRFELLPGDSQNSAKLVAQERRDTIKNWLEGRFSNSVSEKLFRETPPIREGRSWFIYPPDDPNFSFSREMQIERLNTQLQHDAALLTGRVIDSLLCIHHLILMNDLSNGRGQYTEATFSVPLVRLKYQAIRGRYPWRVEIETAPEFRALLRRELRHIAHWIAIGVDWKPLSKLRLAGRCENGDGTIGSLGGTVQFNSRNNEVYGVTCEHVLCDSCTCRVGPQIPPGRHTPDVALIHLPRKCFTPSQTQYPSNVQTADDNDKYIFLQNKTTVILVGGPIERLGVVDSIVSMMPQIGVRPPVEFPHIEIIPRSSKFLFGLVPWPMKQVFSEPGDSGSWVLTEDKKKWLGVLCADDPYIKRSYALSARESITWLEQNALEPSEVLVP
jgi:hypothetical protein